MTFDTPSLLLSYIYFLACKAKAEEAHKEETAVQTDIAEDGEEANANDLRNTKPRK